MDSLKGFDLFTFFPFVQSNSFFVVLHQSYNSICCRLAERSKMSATVLNHLLCQFRWTNANNWNLFLISSTLSHTLHWIPFRNSVIFIPVDESSWNVLKLNTNPIAFHLPFPFSFLLSHTIHYLSGILPSIAEPCHQLVISYEFIFCTQTTFPFYRLNRSNPCNRLHFP